MHTKVGSRILGCLLYGQALFGLVAIAAVAMKDPPAPIASDVALQTVELGSTTHVAL